MRTPRARSNMGRSPVSSARRSNSLLSLWITSAAFEQVISYLFDPDEIFASNLRRAGVRNLIVGSPKITDHEHAARQLARPLERLALYLDDPAAILSPREPRKPDPSLIALHPGSGSERKNWPLTNWAAVADSFLSDDRRIAAFCSSAAKPTAIASRGSGSCCLTNDVQFAQNLPLVELAVRLQNCALFLGHDSGISHLAAAVGTRSFLLFGPTDPGDLGARQSQRAKCCARLT